MCLRGGHGKDVRVAMHSPIPDVFPLDSCDDMLWVGMARKGHDDDLWHGTIDADIHVWEW